MWEFLEIVRDHARRSQAKVAVARWEPGGRFSETTFPELVCEALRIARWLDENADASGFVPMLAGKSATSIACMLAAMATGNAFCFLSPKYRGPQVAAALELMRAGQCVIDATGALALRGALAHLPQLAETKWVLLPDRQLPGVHAAAVAELEAASVLVDLGGLPPSEWHREQPSSPGSDAVGACLFTSGSTGHPKGVLVSAADLFDRATAEIQWFGLNESDVLLSILPFSFDVGLTQLLAALLVGAELVLLDSWLPADILTTVERRRVTGISGVPVIWQDLIQSGLRFDRSNRHRSLRYLTISGGSLARTYLERLPEVVDHADVFKTYGQTEAFRTTSLRPEDFARKLDSVGKAFLRTRAYVVREDGTLCVPGEVGEVVHTGLGVMLGYLSPAGAAQSDDKKRPNPFRGPEDPSPDAIFTGDWGYLDEEGYLFLRGRRDGMVKFMGNRVYPEEVTNQLLALPQIRDAVVLGTTESDGNSVLTAFVIPALADCTAASIRKELMQRLPGYMVPKSLVFVERIPRTPTGKVEGARLLAEYAISSGGLEAATDKS